MQEVETKVCRDCRDPKPLSDFSKHQHCKQGRNPSCKACRNAASAIYYKNNREKVLGRKRGRTKKYYRKHDIKRKYGLTVQQYEALVEACNGKCAVCKGDDKGRTLAVDHCHRTKRVRGLLCRKCNIAIGCMDDDPSRLLLAAAYVESGGVCW